ncbi:MAG: muconate cycloisomerase [Planctomycetes bacterium]|nr:muconate cycloisomerase [Planctomycetota bacterium]
MRITHIETFAVRIPLKAERRMISALGQHTVSDYVLVRIGTDTGVEGAGEATVMPRWSGETVWGAKAVIEHVLAPQLIGCDPRAIAELDARMDRACAHNWFAKSALEMACWDLHGRAVGQPVYQLLGGAQRSLAITCRFSMGAYEPERARRRAAELVAEGFETIKVKVGGDPERDMERVRIVRDTIGPERRIVIDANCGWDADTAIRCVNALADCRIALVEQPTPDGDYAAIARVRREIQPPVMADDMCFNLVHARELIRNQGCDVVSLYPGKNGGIRKSREIAEFCAAHGVACSIGSNLEWDLATAAMGHLIVATPNLQVEKYPGDMLGPEYHEVRIAKNPLDIRGPVVTITDRPGLGVDVDWETVKAHRCPGVS